MNYLYQNKYWSIKDPEAIEVLMFLEFKFTLQPLWVYIYSYFRILNLSYFEHLVLS